jgi:RND family efflux transporter MFP subunit
MKRSLIFALLVAAACTSQADGDTKPAAKTVRPHYALATVERAGVPTVTKLPAQLVAFQEVSIFPKVNGYVKTVQVDLGSRVSAGTLLMVLEAPELEQATLQAKARYAKTSADFALARERYQRLLEAAKTDGAVSPLDLSAGKAQMEADSSLANAEREAWDMQQTMETYLKVVAPFAGVITERNVHPGALVSATAKDKPMLELKEIDRLRLQVEIPEGLAAALQTGDTVSFTTSAFPGERLAGRIARKASSVSQQLRSERVEIDVANPTGRLTPGMYADVLIHSAGNANALVVPKSAVLRTTEAQFVFVIREGRAVRIDVRTGNQTADKVEIFGPISPGEQVIAKASEDIKSGTAVE